MNSAQAVIALQIAADTHRRSIKAHRRALQEIMAALIALGQQNGEAEGQHGRHNHSSEAA